MNLNNGVMEILKHNQNNIHWYWLSRNKGDGAIELLKQNQDKIYWNELYCNENDGAIELLHLLTFQTPIFNSFLTCSNSICLHIGIPLVPCNNIALCVNNNTFLAIDICVNFANNISYIT